MSRAEADRLLTELTQMITSQSFEGLDIEAYLDERDEPEFADVWMRSFHILGDRAETNVEEVLRTYREKAFKQTFAYTGDADLAGYVSDDIGLIGVYLLQDGFQDSFLEKLLEGYSQGRLPLR